MGFPLGMGTSYPLLWPPLNELDSSTLDPGEPGNGCSFLFPPGVLPWIHLACLGFPCIKPGPTLPPLQLPCLWDILGPAEVLAHCWAAPVAGWPPFRLVHAGAPHSDTYLPPFSTQSKIRMYCSNTSGQKPLS